MRKDNGITLIALVVTIVVLLILATVSISMLTGENGVITQAARAKLENRAGTVDERVKLWKTEVKTSKNTGVPVDSENEMLQKLLDEDLVEEEEIDRNAKTITIGERVIDYSITISTTIYNHISGEEIQIEYERGMTWREFVESSYNTVGIFISENWIVYLETTTRIRTDHWIEPDEEIKQTENYYLDFT